MNSRKWHQALVMAGLLALGLVTVVLLALQSTASNAQTKKGSILGFEVAQATPPVTTPPVTTPPVTTPPATTPPATTPPAATPAAAPAVPPSLVVGGLDLGTQVTASISSLRFTLGSITDVASAQAALPQLLEIMAQIDKVYSLAGQLSPEQRTALAGLINPVMATLNQLFDQVLAIPGVARVLKPSIDIVKPKLATLSSPTVPVLTASPNTVVEIVIKEEQDQCIRGRARTRRVDGREECCVTRIRLVRGTNAQFTTNTGKIADLRDVNTVACITPSGDVTYSKSEQSILGFDVAAAEQAPGAGAPGEGAPGAGAPGEGAPGAGAPGEGAPGSPPSPPISNPGGGGTTPPSGGGGTPCGSAHAPGCP
jgi:hypothetical protein